MARKLESVKLLPLKDRTGDDVRIEWEIKLDPPERQGGRLVTAEGYAVLMPRAVFEQAVEQYKKG